jgi:hypothetical protein
MWWWEGVLTAHFIGWGGEPTGGGGGRVKWRPSMALMADDFNDLRGGEGVNCSAHSRGVLKEGCNGSNPVSMARGEGER